MTADTDTFGHLIDNGYSVYAYCDSSSHCHHSKKIDLEAMAARYGRDHGSLHADLIKLPWRCEKCGGRKVSFRYQPGSKQYPSYPKQMDDDLPF
jgi:hypothetical protein